MPFPIYALLPDVPSITRIHKEYNFLGLILTLFLMHFNCIQKAGKLTTHLPYSYNHLWVGHPIHTFFNFIIPAKKIYRNEFAVYLNPFLFYQKHYSGKLSFTHSAPYPNTILGQTLYPGNCRAPLCRYAFTFSPYK